MGQGLGGCGHLEGGRIVLGGKTLPVGKTSYRSSERIRREKMKTKTETTIFSPEIRGRGVYKTKL